MMANASATSIAAVYHVRRGDMRSKLLLMAAALGLLVTTTFVFRTWRLRRYGQVHPQATGLQYRIPELCFDNTPLADVFARLARTSGIRIAADWDSLGDIDIGPEVPITLRLFNVPPERALKLIMESASAHGQSVRYRRNGDGV